MLTCKKCNGKANNTVLVQEDENGIVNWCLACVAEQAGKDYYNKAKDGEKKWVKYIDKLRTIYDIGVSS